MPKPRLFSEHLDRVAKLSGQYLDDVTFQRIRNATRAFLSRCLDVAVLELFRTHKVYGQSSAPEKTSDLDERSRSQQGSPGLRPCWHEGPDDRSIEIRRGDGKLTSQTAFCYAHQKPVWIVAQDGHSKLTQTREYRDLWSSLEDIPPYLDSLGIRARTLIAVPVTDQRILRRSANGVILLESESVLKPTERAKAEVRRIATLIHELYMDTKIHGLAVEKLNLELSRLHEVIPPSPDLGLLQPPKLFFAYSNDTEDEVVGLIREVLSRYENEERIQVVDWALINASGNIDQQILRHLGDAAYGICYFSKREGGHPTRYSDGPSVLFEAGMLQARGDQYSEHQIWIPIRERNSPGIPFDLITQRFLFVPRLDDGTFNDRTFRSQLEKRLEDLLSRRRPF